MKTLNNGWAGHILKENDMDAYLQIADAIKKDIEAIISTHEDCFYSPWAELRKEIFDVVDYHLQDTKKILHLTLHRKWFDLIASGEKKHEFRECKPYWEKRLLHGLDGEPREFDEVHFRNGYAKSAPFMRVKCNGISLSGKKWFTPKHGEELAESVIVIHLGRVLELRNYERK